jgi:hypothetical protein
MTTAIEEAVKAAAAAQAAAQAAQGTSVATTTQTGGAVAPAAPARPAAKLSMDTVMTGQLNVDAWLKPKDVGLFIGDNKEVVASVIASIDMTDGKGFVVKKGIKAGNPATYWYTTDGATCVQGGSWEAAVAKAKSIDPKAYEYRCVDLPFEVLEQVKGRDMKTGVEKVLYEPGTKLGYTTSTTNWKNWEAFYQECLEKGHEGELVQVKLGCEEKSNKAGNTWGVITFELIGSMAEATAGE